MIDERDVFEKSFRRYEPEGGSFERLVRRRDRRRRNQRIAAGVVGIVVFVAAIWIVTSGLWLDRSTPAVPGSKTGPAETTPPRARASAAPDVVRERACSDGARSRLELTDIGDSILVRFEVHRSPVGHSWHIVLRHAHGSIDSPDWHHAWIFEFTKVASESGDLAVQRYVVDRAYDFFFADAFRVMAADQQTGQVCKAEAKIGVV
jgi:hypothetical protein